LCSSFFFKTLDQPFLPGSSNSIILLETCSYRRCVSSAWGCGARIRRLKDFSFKVRGGGRGVMRDTCLSVARKSFENT
jgi:hypothetical protein